MSAYTLTVRHGSRVERERFSDLPGAIDAMRRRVESIQSEGPLGSVRAFREYEPGERVAARAELSTGGWLRGRDAGIDVMGDGSLVAYSGGVRRRVLEEADPYEAVRTALS